MATERNWTITNRDYDDRSLADSTSVFTISNGYMAFKGNIQELPSEQYSTTIINGLFDKIDIFSTLRCSNRERRYLDPEFFDTAGRSPSIANLPNPLFTSIFIGGRQVSPKLGKVRDFKQSYDLRSGSYSHEYEYEDAEGRVTSISMTRFCDMENIHRAYMRYIITPLNHELPVKLRSGIDASVRSNVTGERQLEVTSRRAEKDRLYLDVETTSTKIKVKSAVWVKRWDSESTTMTEIHEEERLYFRSVMLAECNNPIIIDKIVAIASSNDSRYGLGCNVAEELDSAVDESFDSALARMMTFWESLWDRIDVRIEGDNQAQLNMRFALFHLASAAPRHSEYHSVPCKLLTGEHYQGTTFYDTDLYIEPFYVFTNPGWAKNMLSYRYHGIMPAKRTSEGLGFKGAKFAWQSGPDGIECLGDWYRFTKTNIHINGDVAYSLMLYYRATGDIDFMLERGIDILVETSRFYSSRCSYNTDTGGYDMHNVTGPDEGHVACTNDYYTIYIASKNLGWTCEFLEFLKEQRHDGYKKIVKRLFVNDEEAELWREIAAGLTLYFDENTKVYEQCTGFHMLKPIPEDFMEIRDAWFATVFPYQALNQPDVVMAHVLFRDKIPHNIKKANWDFYKPRSMNFSSMSYVINSIMAKEMGEIDDAYRDFMVTAGIDLDPELTGRNDTHEGLHGTALGGAWMAAVFGFGGLTVGDTGLGINPKLPLKWKSLSFKIMLHGEELSFTITKKKIGITVGTEASLSMDGVIAGEKARLESGKKYTFNY